MDDDGGGGDDDDDDGKDGDVVVGAFDWFWYTLGSEEGEDVDWMESCEDTLDVGEEKSFLTVRLLAKLSVIEEVEDDDFGGDFGFDE